MQLKELTVGTFNLYNLNEPGRAVYSDRDGWSEAQYARKIDWTAGVIRKLQPDVLGFQELWHKDSMHFALEKAGLTDAYDLLVPEDAHGTRIVCAAIVRKGLLTGQPEWIVDFPEDFILKSSGDDPQTPAIGVNIDSFSRPVLHFQIRPRTDREPVDVFVCHFKSKGPTQVFREDWYKDEKETYKNHTTNLGAAISTIRRTAEASALRFILTDLMKHTRTPVIVLGDINDGQHSNTLNILTEQPKYLTGDIKGGRDTALYTVQTLQEYRSTRDVLYTHIHQDIMESLDHILVSEEFYDNSRQRIWIFDEMVVNNDHLNFDDHKDSGTNDHGIVLARFKYRPLKDVAQEILAA